MDIRPHNILTPKTLIQQRYRIVRLMGRGGMGAVYEATDTRLKVSVALKQTLVSGAQLRKAFQREALILARLRHAALPVVTDYFVENDAQFLVMQFIPGPDLAMLLNRRDGGFAVGDVLAWADQLQLALDYMHAQEPPVIHRDIKPQNLKLTASGEIVLLDFGLAKGATAQSQAISGSSVFGFTPHYAPLEQIRGSGTTARSDLYALAATLYHLLTGIPPISAMERAEASINGLPDPLVPLHDAAPAVPDGISDVIMQALALRTDARPASAASMRAALLQARGHDKHTADPEQTTVLVTRTTTAHMLGSDPPAERSASAETSVREQAKPIRRPIRRWLVALGGVALLGMLLLALPGLRAAQSSATPSPNRAEIVPTSTPTPTSTITPSHTPSSTPTASPSPTPEPTPTLMPSATTRATARPRPRPTSTPTLPAAAPQLTPIESPTILAPTSTPSPQPSRPASRRPDAAPTASPTEQPTLEPTSDAYPPPGQQPTDTPRPTTEPAATEAPSETPQPTNAPPPTAAPPPTKLV